MGESKRLESDEVAKLFAVVLGQKTALRDRVMLLLWFNAGLGAEEVTKLNAGAILSNQHKRTFLWLQDNLGNQTDLNIGRERLAIP